MTIEQMIENVDEAVAHAKNPKFIKKLETAKNWEMLLGMGLFFWGVVSFLVIIVGANVLIENNIAPFAAGWLLLGGLMGRLAYSFTKTEKEVRRHHLLHSSKDLRHCHVTPASSKEKLRILKAARDAGVRPSLLEDLMEVSRRDDVPHGWWSTLEHMLADVEPDFEEQLSIFQENREPDVIELSAANKNMRV